MGWETPVILSSTAVCKARLSSRLAKTFFTNWSQQFDPAMESREHYLHLRYRRRNIPWLYPTQMTLSEDSIAILGGLQWEFWVPWFSRLLFWRSWSKSVTQRRMISQRRRGKLEATSC